jgi:subtilisin family serine protease
VRRWAPGNAVVSTVPLWQGARQPELELPDGARLRSTPDEDDLTTGFAVWAGTSFATPVVSGLLAGEFAALPDSFDVAERRKRAEKALKITDEKLAKNPWRTGIVTS